MSKVLRTGIRRTLLSYLLVPGELPVGRSGRTGDLPRASSRRFARPSSCSRNPVSFPAPKMILPAVANSKAGIRRLHHQPASSGKRLLYLTERRGHHPFDRIAPHGIMRAGFVRGGGFGGLVDFDKNKLWVVVKLK